MMTYSETTFSYNQNKLGVYYFFVTLLHAGFIE